MSGPAKSILGRLSRFHTRDADEARAFLSTKDYELDLSRSDARQTDLRINGVYLPGAYVGYYQFGAPLVARTHAARHDYWINLPLEEAIEATKPWQACLAHFRRVRSVRDSWRETCVHP